MKYLDNNKILTYFFIYILSNIPTLQDRNYIKNNKYLILSVFLKKSKDNLESAKWLNNKKRIYTSVVHCAYYSSFQVVTHILYYELLRDEKSLKNESKTLNETLHNTKIKNIVSNMIETDPDKAEEFMSQIGELQDLRVDSDYRKIEIGNLESLKAIKLSESINRILYNKYKFKYEF